MGGGGGFNQWEKLNDPLNEINQNEPVWTGTRIQKLFI